MKEQVVWYPVTGYCNLTCNSTTFLWIVLNLACSNPIWQDCYRFAFDLSRAIFITLQAFTVLWYSWIHCIHACINPYTGSYFCKGYTMFALRCTTMKPFKIKAIKTYVIYVTTFIILCIMRAQTKENGVFTRCCTILLSTVVLNSRDWPVKNGIRNFGVSKIHLRVGFMRKNRLKSIGTSIKTLYLC